MPPAHRLPQDATSDDVAAVLDALSAQASAAGLPAQTTDRLVIVAAEAIDNVLQHEATGVEVALGATATTATLSVSGGSTVSGVALPPSDATRGRGLFLIEVLSDAAERRAAGTTLRFVVRPNEDPLLQ